MNTIATPVLKRSILFILESAIVLVFLLTVIYLLRGDLVYSHIRISGSKIEIHNIWRPLLFISALIGIVELLKYLWNLRTRRWAFENPFYYLLAILILYNALVIPSVLYRYYSFGFGFADDLAHTNQALFNTVHGHPLATTCFGYIFNNWNILGDHFTPILLLLIPFYYLWQDAGVLLVIQAVVISIGAVPIYFIARNRLRNEWIGLLISSIYLIYPLITKSIFCEFRFDYLAMVFLIFAFWCLEKQKRLLLLSFILLSLICKENVFIPTALIGLYILFQRRLNGRVYLGLTIIAVSILYGALVWGLFMPYFRQYTMTGVYSHGFNNLEGIFSGEVFTLENIWGNIIIGLSHFFSLIRSLGYVSIFSPVILLNIGHFIENLVGCIVMGPHYVFSWHWHNALFIPFIFISYIYGIKKILTLGARFLNQKKILAAAIWGWVIGLPLASGLLDFNKGIIQPFIRNDLAFSFKPNYYSFAEKANKIIPSEGILLPVFPLSANFSSRKDMHVSVNCRNTSPDYILMSSLTGPINVEKEIFNYLLNSGNYKQYYSNGKFVLYGLKDTVLEKNGLEINFSSKPELTASGVDYRYNSGLGGIYLSAYFDGDEDEFICISERLLNRVDINQYPYFEIVFKVSDPSVQFVEVVFGIDIDDDRAIDRFVSVHYKEDIKIRKFSKYRTNIYELLKELYPDKEDFKVCDVQVYPHKVWGLDCSSDKKGWYRFWIKGVRFFSIYLKGD